VLTEIVPSPAIDTPLPILTPPRVDVVAVVNVYDEPVAVFEIVSVSVLVFRLTAIPAPARIVRVSLRLSTPAFEPVVMPIVAVCRLVRLESISAFVSGVPLTDLSVRLGVAIMRSP